MSKIYILLPVHNRKEITRNFVECLKAQTYRDFHLVLIDDGSNDGTAEMVKEIITSVTVLRGTGKWWWAGSLQQGINWLNRHGVDDRNIVLFANDDISFDAAFLQKAADLLDSLGATLLLPYLRDEKTGLPVESGVEADLQKLNFKPAASPDKINCLPTRGLFMRMTELRKIGGFYPKLLPHYWSDYEFTMRAHRKGIKLRTSAEIAVSLDRDQTGYRSFENSGFADFLKKCFSKRTVLNPVYHTSFVLLTSSLLTMPHNVYMVWRNFFTYVAYKLIYSLRVLKEKFRLANAIQSSRGDLKVIVGSTAARQVGWISSNYPLLDLTDSRMFAELFDSGTVSNFLADHALDYLSPEDFANAVNKTFEYLKQGGLLRITVPDGFDPDANYIDQSNLGGYGLGAGGHKVLYNYRTFSCLLENAGYKVRLLEWYDEQGIFHHENWDVDGGLIKRSMNNEPCIRDNPKAYTSLIIDASKP